jgi:hypothetical protein
MFSDEIIKVVSIAEFVKSFRRNATIIDYVVFDGSLSDHNRDTLEKIIYPSKPKIMIEPKS